MKKFFSVILCIVLLAGLSACGCESTVEEPTGVEDEMPTIIPNDVEEGSAEDIAVRSVVQNYLDTFISADIDEIKAQIHPDDTWLFNFESEDQLSFYKTIFPLVEYKFDFVAEHEGVYGVMTTITSPDMADVYGTVITKYLDTTVAEDIDGIGEIVKNNTQHMLDLIKDPDAKRRVGQLYIYVEHIDGEYIPRCDVYLANELTGGAPEASDEITSTLNASIDALAD